MWRVYGVSQDRGLCQVWLLQSKYSAREEETHVQVSRLPVYALLQSQGQRVGITYSSKNYLLGVEC